MENQIPKSSKVLTYWHLTLALCTGCFISSNFLGIFAPTNAATKESLNIRERETNEPICEEFFVSSTPCPLPGQKLAQNTPIIPPNPQPNPNTDRFIQPAPPPLPTNPEQQRPVLQIPPPQTTPNSPPIKFTVRQIQVIGSTVLSAEEISAFTKPFEGKEVTLQEITSLADTITKTYIERGYITSRAIVPNQTVNDGVVIIRVIEGSLERIEIEGNRRIRASYVRSRVRLGTGTPLNTNRLEEQLRLLRFNPLFENIEASLRSGSELGKSVLVVRVTEANTFNSYFNIDNYSSPSVGSERLGANLRYRNITGFGDEIGVFYSRTTTGGSNSFDLTYNLPVNAREGTLQLRVAPNFYEVTQPPFNKLDIRGESNLYEVSFRQPIFRSPRQEFALSVGFSYRESQTFLADEPTPFGVGPDEEGRTRTSVINFQQEYISRDEKGATSLRSQFSFGIDALDATINSEPTPDGRFISWLAQAQRVQRFGKNNLLILQGDIQLTPDSLLPSQQFVIGGGQSLRGYRQNIRAGDSGFRFSVENRYTLVRDKNGLPSFQVAPFIDLGTVWNKPDNPNSLDEKFLVGAGLGVLWQPFPKLDLRIDYAVPIVSISDKGNNAQDEGFYFRLIYQP